MLIKVKSGEFLIEIFKPNTLDKAKKILDNKENIKILAGGTDLVIDIRKNKHIPDSLLDIGNIEELKNIEEKDDSISIGSMVTFSDLNESEIIKKRYNSLYDCSKTMGSPQIRNVATIGGNVANGASAADSIPCLMALDSKIILESIDGIREIRLIDYFKNYNIEHLRKKEVITKFIIPKKNGVSGYYKLGKRNSLAIARISVAVNLILEQDIIKDISIVVGAAGKVPFEVTDVKEDIINEKKEVLFENEILSILENNLLTV